MSYSELRDELCLAGKVLAVSRISCPEEEQTKLSLHCVLQALERVMDGETLILGAHSSGCSGFCANGGFSDELPGTPGGFGHFLSYGAGEGFRPGQRLRCSPEAGEAYFLGLPKQVMAGANAICVEPYREGSEPDLVLIFATPDQLSALAFLHDFSGPRHDDTLLVTSSGCASLFRIPFGELGREAPRAIIGNTDPAARPYLGENLFSFAVPGPVFRRMLADTGDCFFHAPMWKRLRARIHKEEAN